MQDHRPMSDAVVCHNAQMPPTNKVFLLDKPELLATHVRTALSTGGGAQGHAMNNCHTHGLKLSVKSLLGGRRLNCRVIASPDLIAVFLRKLRVSCYSEADPVPSGGGTMKSLHCQHCWFCESLL